MVGKPDGISARNERHGLKGRAGDMGLGNGMEMDGYTTLLCFVGFCFCFHLSWSMYGMNACVYIYPT